MGIRSLLRKVFGRDRAERQADSPATSVPPQAAPSRQEDAAPTPPPTKDEAQSAADDLVAAAFDNPKVPAARTAERPEAEEAPAVAELPKQATTEPAETAPTAEEPAKAAPAAEEPASEASAEAAPTAEEPVETVPAAEEPATAEAAEQVAAEPQTEAPDASEPEAAAETADEPQAEAEAAETVDAPAEAEAEAAHEPVADEAEAEATQDEPVTETPAADVTETPEQVAAEPQTEAAAETVDAPAEAEATQEPVAVEPEPVADEAQPVVDEATQDEAVADEPVTETSAADVAAEPETEPAAEAEAPVAEPEAAPAEADAEPVEADATVAEPEAAPADEPVAAEAEATPADEPSTAPAPAPGRTVLTSDAPQLVEAYDAAAGVLAERGLVGSGPVAVYLVVDRSGSMRGYFKDGSVQRIAEQTVALAAHLTEDAAVTAVFFSTDIDGTAELRPAGIEGRIDEINAGLGRLGRTNYHRAVEEVLSHHEKTDPTRPAFVVFQTDGAPESKTAATQALAEAAGRPIHWQFVAWGEEDNKAFDFVRKLTAPRTGHYLAGPTPAETAHAEFYRGLLSTWEI
ncbi:VWA domain-containing protein [Streptomyces sp. NPDC056470]|uniref:VWA domain-containing protein n=1 Tax=Streptomyces sp. NPDC056470 TaxID=3345831 RepID=UPI0036C2CAF1